MINRPRTKRVIAAVALVTASAAVAVAATQAAKKGGVKDTSAVVVASVNGEKITRGELLTDLMADEATRMNATNAQLREQSKRQRPMSSTIGAMVLQKMSKNGWKPVTVTREEIMDFAFKEKPDVMVGYLDMRLQAKAVSQEGKKQGVSPSAADIAKEMKTSLDTARKQMPALAGKSDAEVMKEFGVRPDYFRSFVGTTATLKKFVNKELETKVGHPIGPNDFRAASHILIRVNATPTPAPGPNGEAPKAADNQKAWDDGKKKAEGILADIRSGKTTFEDAAKAHSDDGSKFQGGNLGAFTRGQMVGEFEKAAYSQEKGKVGDLVKTQFGYHIIRVDKLGTELTGPEREDVMKKVYEQRMPAKLQEIMAKAKIDNKIKPAATAGMSIPGVGGAGGAHSADDGHGHGAPGR